MITLPQDLRALSLLQPWANLVASGENDVENRLKWKTSNFRGWFLVHASKRPTREYYAGAAIWMANRSLCCLVDHSDERRPGELPPWESYTGPFGGIIGIANVVDVIHPYRDDEMHIVRPLAARSPWYMGGFALVLEGARPLPFIPCKGALGWFRPPADVVARVREEVARLA